MKNYAMAIIFLGNTLVFHYVILLLTKEKHFFLAVAISFGTVFLLNRAIKRRETLDRELL